MKDGDLISDTFSAYEVDEIVFVIAVNLEFSSGITDRTCLKFSSYKEHEQGEGPTKWEGLS